MGDSIHVIGLSGGPDSAALVAHFNSYMLARRRDIRLVHFQSNRVSAAAELRAATEIARHFDFPLELVGLYDHPEFGSVAEAGYSDTLHWCLFSVRAAHALLRRWPGETIHFYQAYHRGDLDAGLVVPALDEQVREIIRYGSGGRLHLQCPLLKFTKAELVSKYRRAVPFNLTYSCVRGGVSHCGSCKACHDRSAALAEKD